MICRVLLLACFVAAAFCQAPSGCVLSADGKTYTCPVQPPAPTLPSLPAQPLASLPNSWMGAGAAWDQYTTPQVAGWASYAKLVSSSGQLYSFTSWDATSSRARPYTAQTSVRSGLASVVRRFGPVYLLGFGDAGMAAAAGDFGGAFSGGGIVVIKLGKTNFTLELAARVLKVAGQTNHVIYEFGFGRTGEGQ